MQDTAATLPRSTGSSARNLSLADKSGLQLSVGSGTVELARTGLIISDGLSFGEWTRLGVSLQAIESGIQWVLGDWINYGESAFGEKYSQAIETTGYTYQSLADIAYVCQRVTISRRRENLRFSHHREVAALDPSEQDALLDAAERGHWSVQKVREAVKIYRTALAPASGRDLHANAAINNDSGAYNPEPEHTPDSRAQEHADELEHADKRIRQLEAENESLCATDPHREILRLHAQLAQERAVNQRLQTERNEARKQAEYAEGVLRKVRKALGVVRDRDILAVIEARPR